MRTNVMPYQFVSVSLGPDIPKTFKDSKRRSTMGHIAIKFNILRNQTMSQWKVENPIGLIRQVFQWTRNAVRVQYLWGVQAREQA